MGLVVIILLAIVFQIVSRMLRLDAKIFILFNAPVRFWSKWTGKSNFALTRLLVLLISAVLLGVGLWSMYVGNIPGAIINLIFAVFISCWALMPFGPIHKVEKLIGESEGEILPAELHKTEKGFVGTRYFILTMIMIYVSLGHWGIPLIHVLYLLPCYVLFHYNAGGKSKLKEKIKDLASPPKELAPVHIPTRK